MLVKGINIVSKNEELFPSFNYISVEESLKFLNELQVIGVDTETTGLDCHTNKVIFLQLGNEDYQILIDDTIDYLQYKGILEDTNKLKVLQNAKFDLKFLYKLNIWPQNIYDTFLAESLLYKGMSRKNKPDYNLEALAGRYTGYKISKEERKNIIRGRITDRTIVYAADDIKVLIPIMEGQMKSIKHYDLENSLAIENLFVPVLTYVEYCGIKLDVPKWKIKIQEDNAALKEVHAKLSDWVLNNNLTKYIDNTLFGKLCSIKWSSTKQVIPLMEDLGLKVSTIDKKTKKVKKSLDAKIVAPQKTKSEFIPMYLDYKGLEKKCSTYGQNFIDQINPVTNRIHSNFTQIIATGRMSSGGKVEEDSESNSETKTINLQNIPADEKVRSCFISDKGYSMIDADYDSQEVVIFTNKTKDKALIDFFVNDLKDFHSFTAHKLFPEIREIFPVVTKETLKEIKKQFPEHRALAKKAVFGINYGAQGITISINCDVPLEVGEAIYKSYFEMFTGVKDYFAKVKSDAIDKGYILINEISKAKTFIDGYYRYNELNTIVNKPGYWTEYRREKEKNSTKYITQLKPLVKELMSLEGKIARSSYNYPVQGTGSECTKLAGIYLFDYIRKNNLFNIVLIPNLIHDEIITEQPDELNEEIAQVVKQSMEKAGSIYCKTIPLTANPIITKFWKH